MSSTQELNDQPQDLSNGDEPLWSDGERRAWEPPERIGTPEWAEKYRYLTRRQSKMVGWWRNENSPATVGFMRLADRPGVRTITALKHSQGGWSEATRNIIARRADLMPDPLLVVLPNKDKGKEIIHDRLIPLFEDTEKLKPLSTGRRWDTKNSQITLRNDFTLRLGYSGSIASVASHPARLVICDERSKFEDSGKVSIADSIEARTSTFDDPLVINTSTPGSEPDPTHALFEAADVKLYYFVPCPHCGTCQRLIFDRLKWSPTKKEQPDKNKRAKEIIANKSAWFECENPRCAVEHPDTQGQITEDHKRIILLNGFWGTADQSWKLYFDGREDGAWPGGESVGMHAPAFISLFPGHAWYRVAAAFVRAEGDPTALRGVYNELLAEVFRSEVTVATSSNELLKRCTFDPETGYQPPKARVLPPWVSRLLMTVDTQKDHFYWVIRGWGYALRSQRIAHGKAFTFDELQDLFFSFWRYEDDKYPARRCYRLGIDSGGGIKRTDESGLPASRTMDVYRFCRRQPSLFIPLKGEGRRPLDQPHRWRKQAAQFPGDTEATPFWLLFVDANHYEDILDSHMRQELPVVDAATGEVLPDQSQHAWLLNDDPDPEYLRHLTATHKVRIQRKGKRPEERWVTKIAGQRHDYRDAEVYQEAMAYSAGNCVSLPSPEALLAELQNEKQAQRDNISITDAHGRPMIASQRR